MFHTCVEVDGVTLTSVLGDVGVDEVDDIGSDSGGEDSREDQLGLGAFDGGLAFSPGGVVDVHELSVDHGQK